MTEAQIQSKKIKELEAQGYYVIKLIKTNKNGIPDLIAIPKNSDVLFIEVKGRDLPLGKLKRRQAEDLYGIDIHVVKTTGDVNKVIETHG